MSAPRPTPVPRVLADLVADLGGVRVLGDEARTVTGATLDSRDVRPGDLFAALPGAHHHGAQYVERAVDAGAVAVLTDPASAEAMKGLVASVVVAEEPRAILGRISARVYGDPASRLRTAGVTGTNGKTTVTYLIEAAVRAAGRRTGLIGTTGCHIGERTVPSARTTPESPDLQALLAVMVEEGVDAVALEVSSHSLVLGRVDGLVVDVACFTNLSPDHLDFHGDMEAYFAAKASLFTSGRARSAVICVDDEWGQRLAAECALPVTTYGASPAAQWRLAEARATGAGQVITMATPDGERRFTLPMSGPFNAVNATAAAACVQRMGFDVPEDAFARVTVPGRMQSVDAGQSFLVVIDYAHSPDAIERVLDALRTQVSGRVIVVLGCGGDRDRLKRPAMGECAARCSDLFIATDDNPRSEDPAAIRTAMLSGVPADAASHVVEIPDRAEAIRHAIASARAGDAVAILGKGHETGQEIAGVVHPFDDCQHARRCLAEVGA